MGARVISGDLTASNWTSKKPPDYKQSGLDKALKNWEKLAAKRVTKVILPTGQKIKEWESLAKELGDFVKHLKECSTQLDAVISAAAKAQKELKQMASKGTGSNQEKYSEAANVASAIGSRAGDMKKEYV